MKKQYIHYGHDHFNKDLFVPITGTDKVNNKPKHKSCFWASPVDTDWGWKDWFESYDYKCDKYIDSFKFTLVNGSKVFHIRTLKDVYKLPMIKPLAAPQDIDFISAMDWYYNWKQISKKYDAVELHYSELYPLSHEIFYGWDVDSIVIFNPDIVREAEE